MVHKKSFLKKHRNKIVQNTRNPLGLADVLLSEDCISSETNQKIKIQKTTQDKTREILDCLNSEKIFDCTYDWLKENEAELFRELEADDTDLAAPQQKRTRLENKDETDNNFTELPDYLKMNSSSLERWVSQPETSKKLISDLKGKLGEDGMEDLRTKLKNKEPKNSLRFSVKDIDDVRKNKELDTFLNATNSETFPNLVWSMFFKKRSSAPLGNKSQISTDIDTFMDIKLDLSSSGYKSSSFNDSWCPNYLTDGDDLTGDTDVIIHENNDSKSASKTSNQLHGGSLVPEHHEGKADAPLQEPQDVHTGNGDISLSQEDPITKKEIPQKDETGNVDMLNTHIDMKEESQRSSVPSHAVSLQQNEIVITDNMSMQPCEKANIQNNPSKFSSTQPQKISPGSEFTQSTGAEITGQNKNTTMLPSKRDMRDPLEAPKKRKNSKYKKEEKIKEQDKLLRDWALKQCKGCVEELKDIFDQIEILNMAEHSDYPCFTADNVMVYKNLTESQIIFISDDNTSIVTTTMVHYLLFVCNFKKAILLGPKKPKEREMQYDESKVPIEKCRKLISKAFAPALAVYKQIQKEERLYSLLSECREKSQNL